MRQLTAIALTLAVSTLALAACGEPKVDDTGPPDTDDTIGTTDTGDTQEPEPGPPCAGGIWGHITDPDNAIHVRRDGDDDDGDGSASNPLDSVQAALDLIASDGTLTRIAIGPGEFQGNDALSAGYHDGVVIQGCSVAETILEGRVSDQSVLAVSAASDVTIEGLSVRGGTNGVMLWSGAAATLREVSVTDSYRSGISIGGNDTTITLDTVEVHSPRTFSDGSAGYGLLIQQGAAVDMTAGGIYFASLAGILIEDSAEVSLSGVTVQDTLPSSTGALGRGIVILNYTEIVTIDDVTLTANTDAGIYSSTTFQLTITDSVVEGTAAGTIADSGDTTGDGIVVSQGDQTMNPADFTAIIDGNTVTDSARAGIVLDAVTASVSDNTLTDNGYDQGGISIVSQNGALVSGSDDVVELDEPLSLEHGS